MKFLRRARLLGLDSLWRFAHPFPARLTARGMLTMSSQARVLERPDRVPARNGSKTAKKPSAYCEQPSATSATSDQDWAAKQVREWLCLLLRFCISAVPKVLFAPLALADSCEPLSLGGTPSP